VDLNEATESAVPTSI